jgi:hypothetical protein
LEKFGHPSGNKKRGHKVTKLNGIKGVLVPCDGSQGPWKVIRSVAGTISKQDKHETGSGSDEADPDDIDSKFKDMIQEDQSAYDSTCVGVVASILAQCSKEADSKDEAPRSGNSKGHPSAAQAASSSSKDIDLSARKRRSSWISSGSEDEGRHRKGIKGSKGSGAAPKKAAVRAAQGSTGHASGTAPSATQASQPEKEKSGSLTGKAGRPEKVIEAIASEHIYKFRMADESSLYFGEGQPAQLRSISRYIVTVSSKVLSAPADKEEELTMAKKQLQVVEAGMKVHVQWLGRKARGQAVLNFNRAWESLLAFCASDPVCPLQCGFLWELHLQVYILYIYIYIYIYSICMCVYTYNI